MRYAKDLNEAIEMMLRFRKINPRHTRIKENLIHWVKTKWRDSDFVEYPDGKVEIKRFL